MSSIALASCAIVAYVVLALRTRHLVAPSALLCLFWFGAASLADVQSLKHPTLQQAWEFETYAAIYIAGFSMFSGGLFQLRNRWIKAPKFNPTYTYRLVINFLIWSSVAAVILRLYVFGFSFERLLQEFGGSDLKNLMNDAIPGVHYFEIMTPFLCLCAIYELKSSEKIERNRRFGLIVYVLYTVLVYSIILSVSRGSLLVIITGVIYLYVRNGQLQFWHLITVGLSVVAAMSGLSFLRMSSGVLTNSFLGDSMSMMFLSPIYTYIAFNFENFNTLVRSDLSPTYAFYSLKFLFWPILKSEYESGGIILTNFDTLFFNARTFLYPFYHDLGVIGCAIYPGIISFVLSLMQNSIQKNPGQTMLMMGLQKPIWFAFFGNYFFGELVLFIPFIVMAFLGWLYQRAGLNKEILLCRRSVYWHNKI